jgi:WD40 repeat protein
VAFSPDGSQLVSGSYDNTVRLWNVASGKLLKTWPHQAIPTNVIFHPNGRQIVSCEYNKTVLRLRTVCKWSDRVHRLLFGDEMKRLVFCLICIKEINTKPIVPQLPMEMWLCVFETMAELCVAGDACWTIEN